MNDITKANTTPMPKKQTVSINRVSLSKDAAQRADTWVVQANDVMRGRKLTRSDLVDWSISIRAERLTDRELHQIAEKFFDPIRALEIAIEKAKAAQAAGVGVEITKLINAEMPRPRKLRVASKRAKSKETIVDGSQNGAS